MKALNCRVRGRLGWAVGVVLLIAATSGLAAPAAAAGAADPSGNLETVTSALGSVDVAGWAFDPDSSRSIYVWVTVDGVGRHVLADVARPDVEAAYRGAGPKHGFRARVAAAPGSHTICAVASNIGPGAHRPLGCRSVSVLGPGAAAGNLDAVNGADGRIDLKGWAIDGDTTEPVYVWVTLDGRGRHLLASADRPDVATRYPWYGRRHGFAASLAAEPGTHTVCVTVSNVGAGSHRSLGCRTAVALQPQEVLGVQTDSATASPSVTSAAPATAPTPSASGASSPTGRVPGPGTVGVPAGTSLRVYEGDLVITTPGTVIDGWDIRGYVWVKADNVTIRRSVLRGGPAATRDRALLMAWWGYRNLVVEDSTLVAANPSLYTDGVSGSNFTARRLDISAVVDPVKVIGNNVSVLDSWLHDTFHSTNDPTHADGKTHDDNVQITGGSNIVIRGNVMEDAHNAAIMISQGYAPTTQVRIESNWLGGGACTINATNSPITTPIAGMSITGNRFRPGSHDTRCPMRLPSSAQISVTSNTWDATGAAATPNWF